MSNKKVNIFVEGAGDVKFISDYISHIIHTANITPNKTKADICTENIQISIYGLTGWTDINNMKSQISRYRDDGMKVLVIFDADTANNAGGFAVRKKQIEDYNLVLDDIFLFPNNKDDGELENLLEKIINNKNKSIFDCWDKYEDCLRGIASKQINKKLTTPSQKAKIYAYLGALLDTSKEKQDLAKDPKRNYKNPEHWNLDCLYLDPLKSFLLKNLS